ncbi:metallophosphoesterase family protein [Terracoccus luteus]|uniref:Putative phosphoesterase n=1 Tax=Terracoccus luteus TaxID=53356 RepID=A0A839PTA1_9MICO|nr:metallophosphoesterase family protein [Terracoccus luteus]MBB2985245.1 putative phosphoesterase [Terracoccus luteus]MCP2170897.1 putative phosphoesterase [Terracoccus luteus]
MTRSIAVLSDTHGVLPTLDAVLAEPDVRAADVVVVTGDLAAGPQPTEVLDLLLGLSERVVLVRGNADRDLVTGARGGALPEGTPEIDRWAAAQLDTRHVELLAGLRHPVTLSLDGVGDVLFCHGTPRDDDEVVLVDTRPSRWAQVLADVPDTVRIVCCGHTHAPFVRLVGRRWVVNSGSVGMPYGTSGVPWVLLDDHGVSLRSTTVDVADVARAVVVGSTFPGVGEWVRDYVLEPPSDLDALTAFALRDGRSEGWDDPGV